MKSYATVSAGVAGPSGGTSVRYSSASWSPTRSGFEQAISSAIAWALAGKSFACTCAQPAPTAASSAGTLGAPKIGFRSVPRYRFRVITVMRLP